MTLSLLFTKGFIFICASFAWLSACTYICLDQRYELGLPARFWMLAISSSVGVAGLYFAVGSS